MSLNTLFDNGTHKIQSAGTIVTPAPATTITKLAFKNRFTQAERIALRTASQTDPVVFDFMDLVSDATFIDLSRQDTMEGVNYIESQGYIDEGRADDILTSPVQPGELA